MLQFCCECGAVFSGDTDREIMVAAVEHACQEHDTADTPAQTAVQVLDNIVEAV
jgi:predicted small metal-binding protein